MTIRTYEFQSYSQFISCFGAKKNSTEPTAVLLKISEFRRLPSSSLQKNTIIKIHTLHVACMQKFQILKDKKCFYHCDCAKISAKSQRCRG